MEFIVGQNGYIATYLLSRLALDGLVSYIQTSIVDTPKSNYAALNRFFER